jgi:hypothetical protein
VWAAGNPRTAVGRGAFNDGKFTDENETERLFPNLDNEGVRETGGARMDVVCFRDKEGYDSNSWSKKN